MKYLSVCSGIEAATVAWHSLGWTPVGFSEIEKFPSSVLDYHYPDVPNYGDMLDHERWPTTDIDVLVGGTPCQSFSVAGLRQGMRDPRGNLALTYLAIAEQYRPTWLVWENVPGVLSSHGGRDFGAIIGGMVELGYSPCWRVLDAQYFGVPQRRRRVFVVASSRDWRDSAKVLFEPESLLRNPSPSRETGEEVAGTFKARAKSGGWGQDVDLAASGYMRTVPETVGTLSDGAHCGGGLNGQDAYSGRIIPVVGALTAKGPEAMGAPEVDGNHYLPVSFNWQNGGGYGNANEGLGVDEDRAGPCSRSQVQAVAFAQNQRDEVRLMDKAGALAAVPGAKQQTYVFKPGQGKDARSDGISETTAPTLSSDQGGNAVPATMHNMAVRRLTPRECERLQGFPDDYTNIPGASDSGRYKALGNSMAVPVMRWIGKRINDENTLSHDDS